MMGALYNSPEIARLCQSKKPLPLVTDVIWSCFAWRFGRCWWLLGNLLVNGPPFAERKRCLVVGMDDFLKKAPAP